MPKWAFNRNESKVCKYARNGTPTIKNNDHQHTHEVSDVGLLKKSFYLITGFMVIELIAGFVTNALVLIADAGHMFLDSAALGLAW